MSKITLYWHSTHFNGIPDGLVEDKYQLALKLAKEIGQTALHISNMLILMRFRVGLKEEDFDELYFVKGGTEVRVAAPNAWHPIFNDIDINFEYLHRLIR